MQLVRRGAHRDNSPSAFLRGLGTRAAGFFASIDSYPRRRDRTPAGRSVEHHVSFNRRVHAVLRPGPGVARLGHRKTTASVHPGGVARRNADLFCMGFYSQAGLLIAEDERTATRTLAA